MEKSENDVKTIETRPAAGGESVKPSINDKTTNKIKDKK